MLDYTPEKLLGYTQSGSFVTARSRAEVERAAREWAAGLGWRQSGPALSFRFERILLPPYLHVDVAIMEEARETTVLVTALMSVWAGEGGPYLGEGAPAPLTGFLEKLGESFAAGVWERLEFQDRPTRPGRLPRDLTRLLRFDQGLRRLFLPLMALGPVLLSVASAVRGFRPDPAAIAAAVLWLAAGYMSYQFLRWRNLGAGYGWVFIVSLLLWVGVMIAAGFALGG
jgi:hypothetical protein